LPTGLAVAVSPGFWLSLCLCADGVSVTTTGA